MDLWKMKNDSIFPLEIWIHIICFMDFKTLSLIPLLNHFFRNLCKNSLHIFKKRILGFDFKTYKLTFRDIIWILENMEDPNLLMIGPIWSLNKLYKRKFLTLIDNDRILFIPDGMIAAESISADSLDIKMFYRLNQTKSINFDDRHFIGTDGLFVLKIETSLNNRLEGSTLFKTFHQYQKKYLHIKNFTMIDFPEKFVKGFSTNFIKTKMKAKTFKKILKKRFRKGFIGQSVMNMLFHDNMLTFNCDGKSLKISIDGALDANINLFLEIRMLKIINNDDFLEIGTNYEKLLSLKFGKNIFHFSLIE